VDIINLDEKRRWSEEKMQKVGLFATHRGFADVYCFEPGQFQKIHNHQNADKIYIVLEGEGRFVMGDEQQTLKPNQALVVKAPVTHGVFNDTDDRLVVLCFLAGDYPTGK
jgi:mannose-6-phosphate isomerase-like protein (cupin superfamily)